MACPPNTISYTIKQGDTFYALAKRYNTTVDAIMAANPGVDPRRLQIGQIICIPRQQIYPPCSQGNYYTIKAGDTFYALAKKYNTTVDAIMAANPGVDPRRLQIGQVICLPGNPVTPSCPQGTLYTIRAGDTFYAIARRNNITVDALIAANPGVDPMRLQIGQVICVPRPITPSCPQGNLYTIKAGDTLYSIAGKFNIPLNSLIAANPGINPTGLQIGQVICIPLQVSPGTCPTGYRVHVVMAGDTMYALSYKYGVSVESIMKANPGVNPNYMLIGQTLCIPPM